MLLLSLFVSDIVDEILSGILWLKTLLYIMLYRGLFITLTTFEHFAILNFSTVYRCLLYL